MKKQTVRINFLLIWSIILTVPINTLGASLWQESFEQVALNHLPTGWIKAGTNARQTTAIWKVIATKEAPDGHKVLSLSGFLPGYGGAFNVYYTPKPRFKNGEISVWFKANSGRIDQGGGIMWRVQDKQTYYVARFNPLEDNFRYYSVINGHRRELCSADIHLKSGWHQMRIIQQGEKFSGFLDNQLFLSCRDGALVKSGGVGVWTKADAATSFDAFVVKTRE